jgi:hypothetical protein
MQLPCQAVPSPKKALTAAAAVASIIYMHGIQALCLGSSTHVLLPCAGWLLVIHPFLLDRQIFHP